MSQSVQIREYGSAEVFAPADAPGGPSADGVHVTEAETDGESTASMEYGGAVADDERYQTTVPAAQAPVLDALDEFFGAPDATETRADTQVNVYDRDDGPDSISVRAVDDDRSVVSAYMDSFSSETARDVREAAYTAVQADA
ncbi:MAG: hypothetical protein SVU88_02370 [Candidatus Nanohaloarchaea archaeon]|nr:hypothetical protein [Candidatus Nanohaloarchaea archaeon]